MSVAGWLIYLVVLAPIGRAGLIWLAAGSPILRDVVSVAAALGGAVGATLLVAAAPAAMGEVVVLGEVAPDVRLGLLIEPLGVAMAALIAWLAALLSLFDAGYSRAVQEPAPARRGVGSALAVSAALMAVLSANAATAFVALIALALAAFGTLALSGEGAGRRGAFGYLAVLLLPAMGLLAPAVVALHAVSDGAAFAAGGALPPGASPAAVSILLCLATFGVAAGGLAPFIAWGGAAEKAPAPTGAVIHGIVVTPVGAFVILKVCVYVFGPALETAVPGALVILGISAASLVGASLAALARQDLRSRLGLVIAGQAAGAVAAGLFASPAGLLAAVFQIYALACGAATAFMAVGAVRAATGRERADEMAGLGRVMPWTFAGYAVAVVSIVGFAPFAGAWGKLWLIMAAVDRGFAWWAAAVALGAVASFVGLALTASRAFSQPAPIDPFRRPDGATVLVVAPILISAGLLTGLLAMVDPINAYLAPIWESAP